MSNLSISINVGLAKSGKPQKWLASKLGYSIPYMSKICNGYSSLKFEKTAQIAALFEVDHSEFVSWSE